MDIQVKVGVVIVNNDKKILLIKEKLEKNPTALWNIVKGTYEEGEGILNAVKRECHEEVSLNVEIINSLGVSILESPENMRVQLNFLAKPLNDEDLAKIPSTDEQLSRNEAIEELRWFTREEILELKGKEFVSMRAKELLGDYISGKVFPLEVLKDN